jgi:hypothetical protein
VADRDVELERRSAVVRPPAPRCATLVPVTSYRVRFEGPAPLALQTATALADADGVDLVSSEPASTIGERGVRLEVHVEATLHAVTEALVDIRRGLPADASIALGDD